MDLFGSYLGSPFTTQTPENPQKNITSGGAARSSSPSRKHFVKNNNIKVACIFRKQDTNSTQTPLRKHERVTLHPTENSVEIPTGSMFDRQRISFHRVFSPEDPIRDVVEMPEVKEVVDAVTLRGGNGLICCYGPTGGGKTYTMGGLSSGNRKECRDNIKGSFDEGSVVDDAASKKLESHQDGIIPYAIHRVYDRINSINAANEKRARLGVCISYYELYNGKLIDLLVDSPTNKKSSGSGKNAPASSTILSPSTYPLSPSSPSSSSSSFSSSSASASSSSSTTPLSSGGTATMKEPKILSNSVTGLINLDCSSPEEVMRAFAKAQRNRSKKPLRSTTTPAYMSSRSHAFLCIYIINHQSKESNLEHHDDIYGKSASSLDLQVGPKERGRLLLVDLAGFESVSLTRPKGDRLVEAKYIDSSTGHLAHLISASMAGEIVSHRGSRLSHLLSSSLSPGENNHCLFLLCCALGSSRELLFHVCSCMRFGQLAMGTGTQAKPSPSNNKSANPHPNPNPNPNPNSKLNSKNKSSTPLFRPTPSTPPQPKTAFGHVLNPTVSLRRNDNNSAFKSPTKTQRPSTETPPTIHRPIPIPLPLPPATHLPSPPPPPPLSSPSNPPLKLKQSNLLKNPANPNNISDKKNQLKSIAPPSPPQQNRSGSRSISKETANYLNSNSKSKSNAIKPHRFSDPLQYHQSLSQVLTSSLRNSPSDNLRISPPPMILPKQTFNFAPTGSTHQSPTSPSANLTTNPVLPPQPPPDQTLSLLGVLGGSLEGIIQLLDNAPPRSPAPATPTTAPPPSSSISAVVASTPTSSTSPALSKDEITKR